jgi:hypothetical protein
MKFLTVWFPETQTAINVKREGNRHISNLLPWLSNLWSGMERLYFCPLSFFLECERNKSSFLKSLSRAVVDILMLIGTLVDHHKSASVWAWMGSIFSCICSEQERALLIWTFNRRDKCVLREVNLINSCFIAPNVLYKYLPLITPNCSLSATLLSVHPGGDALIVSRPPSDTIHTRTACQPPKERQRGPFPSQLPREIQTESKSQGPN